MRLFRRESRRIRDLEQSLCWADERNARLRQRLERTLNDVTHLTAELVADITEEEN